jgi:Invasion associated locus B (IalB) protein
MDKRTVTAMKRRILFAALIACATASSAFAQGATKVGQHNAWGTYAYAGNTGKVCYVLSVPTQKTPESVDHGDIYFSVSQMPGKNISFEPQFISSYNFKEGSNVTVAVGGKSFSMFTRGKLAWMENAAEEPALITAMKSGSSMSIKATSGRGTKTGYEFSLKGISAALDSIKTCQ